MVAQVGMKRKQKAGEEKKDDAKVQEAEKEFQESYDEVKKEVEALVRPSLSPPLAVAVRRRLIDSPLVALAGGRHPDLLGDAGPRRPDRALCVLLMLRRASEEPSQVVPVEQERALDPLPSSSSPPPPSLAFLARVLVYFSLSPSAAMGILCISSPSSSRDERVCAKLAAVSR